LRRLAPMIPLAAAMQNDVLVSGDFINSRHAFRRFGHAGLPKHLQVSRSQARIVRSHVVADRRPCDQSGARIMPAGFGVAVGCQSADFAERCLPLYGSGVQKS